MTTTAPDTKVGEVENEIPDHAKYITTPEFNKFAGAIIDRRLKQANFITNKDLNNVSQCTNKNKEKKEKRQMFDLS